MENVDKITLVCTSHNPDYSLLEKMLKSAWLFDSQILHINGSIIRHDNKVGKYETFLSIPDAYNHLINNFVDTEWICCFCDDDYFYPDELARMISEIHRGNARDCGIAHFKFHISGYMPPQDKRRWLGIKEYDLCEKKPITPELLVRHGRLPAGSFFRKSAWKKAGGFQGTFEHDRDLWIRMAMVGCKFKYFDHLVYNLVRRPNSAWIKQKGAL